MARWTERFSLGGRRALVTGASKGIGREIAAVFADAGADVALVARDAAGLEETAATVRAEGRESLTIEADLADAGAVRRAAETTLQAWGAIDILVNAAGVALTAPALEASLEDWERTMAVNLRAPFLLSQALAPAMIRQGRGKIVMISSQTGVIAARDHAAYATSKGGLNALTKSLMAEWAPHNIQVNAICPTVILTPMGLEIWGDPAKGQPMIDKTPAGRFGQPQEVADLALYLASPASDLMNGEILMLEGGFSSV